MYINIQKNVIITLQGIGGETMKEATGEVSMTVITLVAIAVIGAILAVMWPTIRQRITGLWNTEGTTAQQCAQIGGTWDAGTQTCRQ